jgi:hypothetical protein
VDSNLSEELFVGLICAIVGALVGALIQRVLERRCEGWRLGPRTWTQVNVFVDTAFHSSAQHPPAQYGGGRFEVGTRKDEPAARPVSVLRPPLPPMPRARSKSNTDSDIELVLLAVMGVFGAASVLLNFRDDLIAGVIIGTGALAGALMGAFGYFIALRALTGWQWTAFLVSSLVVLSCGVAGAVALDSPTFANYEQLLRAYERGGLAEVLDRFGVDGIFFAAYQLIGVALLVVAALAVLSALLLMVGRINYVVNARGQWLWQRLVPLSFGHARPIPLLAGAGLCAALSFLFISGLLYDLVNDTSA